MSPETPPTMPLAAQDGLFAPEPDPCAVLGCDMQTAPVEACRKRGCGFRWTREGREDRKTREAKDAQTKPRKE